MSDTASFYSTDLEVMMAFVLDRSKFLDSVVDAITTENTDPAAAQFISLLENQTFLLTMPALLCDKDADVRKKAYLALGNLIASDNAKIARLAFHIAAKSFKYVERGFESDATFAGAAYVLHNLALRIRQWEDNNADMLRTATLSTAKKMIRNECANSAKKDLLFAVNNIGKATDVPVNVLLALMKMKNKSAFRVALNMLSDQLSADFDSDYLDETYDTLRLLIAENTHEKIKAEVWRNLLWAFSNLVVEPGMADKFLDDHAAITLITEITEDEVNYLPAVESAWTLVNAIAKATLDAVEAPTLITIYDTLVSFNMTWATRSCLKTAIQEAKDTINKEFTRRDDEEAAAAAADVARWDAPMDIDDEAETLKWPDTTPFDDGWTADVSPIPREFSLPCEIFCPPSAVSLLLADRTFEPTSEIVAHLINLVQKNKNEFVDIPETATLTVKDLRDLESRGFTIYKGQVGIHPVIASALNGF